MPVYKRLPRSKPKKPDEFISFFDKLYHEAYKRGPSVLAVLAVVALVGVGILFWKEFHERRAQRLSENIFDVSSKGKEEQEKTLNDIKKANLYAPLGMWASLQLANQAMDEGKCDDVIKELEMYVGHGDNAAVRSLIYQKVGVCLEQKKEWQKASELYQKASDDSRNLLKDWATLHWAQVKREAGDEEGAKKILQGLLKPDSEASTPVKEEARTALSVNVPTTLPAAETKASPESKPVK